VTFASDTTFWLANLDKYAPTDPCRQAALNYNTITGDDSIETGINGLIGCNARIWTKKAAPVDPCRAFRPVP